MTTAPVVDHRLHAAAARAAVTDELGDWQAYEYGKVPESLPHIYALVSVERRFTPSTRMSGYSGRSAWRLSVRTVGRSPDEARWAMARATAALDEQRLTISGAPSSLLQFESSTDAEPDEGRYSALTQWIYTL